VPVLSRTTHDVATKQANQLGLYDMTGNAAEWCFEWVSGVIVGGSKYYRGGHFDSYYGVNGGDLSLQTGYMWSSSRNNCNKPYFRDDWQFTCQYASCIGFRIARYR
jgi:formylglycine-generating enzyme required for sulfatase activity